MMFQPSVITASLELHLLILNPPPTWWVLPPKDLSNPLLLQTSITTFYLTSFFLDYCSNFYTHLLWSFHSPNYFYKRSSSRHTFDLVTLLFKTHTQTDRKTHTHLFIQYTKPCIMSLLPTPASFLFQPRTF